MTQWNDDVYLFGMDKQAIIDKLSTMSRENSLRNSYVDIVLLAPEEEDPQNLLKRTPHQAM